MGLDRMLRGRGVECAGLGICVMSLSTKCKESWVETWMSRE